MLKYNFVNKDEMWKIKSRPFKTVDINKMPRIDEQVKLYFRIGLLVPSVVLEVLLLTRKHSTSATMNKRTCCL